MRQLKISKSITNRNSQSLEKYLQEIGKEDLVSTDEEVELATQTVMAAIEPMIILVLALIVGVLVAAVMAPMLSMYQAMDSL